MATISFIGDISLNDDYTRLFKEGARPFQNLSQELEDSDLVAGNLECLSSGTEGENLEKKPRLKTNLETMGYLKQINLGLACLAHNHVYDNLENGFLRTTDYLQQNNIRYIGASVEKSQFNSVLKLEIKGIRFAFFNYVDRDTNPSIPPDAGIRLSILEKERVLHELSQADNADFRILMLHWGGKYENSYYPGPPQIQMAREFIRGGADLIIGHHSHTLQPLYKYRGKSIYFSLGNFCFADVRSDNRIKEIRFKRWKESAIIKVNFTRESYTAKLVPFRLVGMNTIQDHSVNSRLRMRQRYFNFMRFSKLFWYIYYFGFKYIRPVVWELRRPNPERGMLKRLAGLNRKKLEGMFK